MDKSDFDNASLINNQITELQEFKEILISENCVLGINDLINNEHAHIALYGGIASYINNDIKIALEKAIDEAILQLQQQFKDL